MRPLLILCVLVSGCAARSGYVSVPVKPVENYNGTLQAVSLDLLSDGRCVLTDLSKDGRTEQIERPRERCEDAKRVKAAMATVAQPKASETK